MTDSMFSLEEWTAKVSASAKGNTRAVLAHFQRHWYEGHLQNPLLFPMDQTHQAWKAHLDWFLTVEKFKLPDRKAASHPAPEKKAPDLTAPPPPDSAETVFFNVENHDRGGQTVIYEDTPPAATNADEWGELDDLGTLILASRAGRTTGNRSDETTDKAPPAETVVYGPDEASDQTMVYTGQGDETAIYTPGRPDVEQDTIIMSPRDPDDNMKDAPGTSSVQTARPPLQKPTPKTAKTDPAASGPDVDLDLADLDTMIWLDDEEKTKG